MESTFGDQLQPPPPKNWLIESILVTVFCCLPFGIAGIVFASQVNAKYGAGDYNGAIEASKNAAKWTKVGFFIGLGFLILYFIGMVFFGMSGFWASRNYNNY
jgi:hypothetical protein